MSNPFLKSNNRFQFLDPDHVDNKMKKEKQVVQKYDSTDNSFTKSSNRRDDRRDDRNQFKSNYSNQLTKNRVSVDFSNEFVLELDSPSLKPKFNFKDAINNQIKPEIFDETKNVKPGWVKISYAKNNKIIHTYGPLSKNQLKLKKEEELENNLNHCINREITIMKYRWDKYEDDYDKLNGEGAYIEKYRLIPIYGDEYDDDVDSDTQCEDDINELYDE